MSHANAPAAPWLFDQALWTKAAKNLVDRAEGLLRDELAWRRAHICLMAEYFRLALEENVRILNPWRRSRYRHWNRLCKAEHAEGKTLCPFHDDGTPDQPHEGGP